MREMAPVTTAVPWPAAGAPDAPGAGAPAWREREREREGGGRRRGGPRDTGSVQRRGWAASPGAALPPRRGAAHGPRQGQEAPAGGAGGGWRLTLAGSRCRLSGGRLRWGAAAALAFALSPAHPGLPASKGQGRERCCAAARRGNRPREIGSASTSEVRDYCSLTMQPARTGDHCAKLGHSLAGMLAGGSSAGTSST